MDGYHAWMLMSASLVLAMTAPALSLFYGGMSRSKSVLNMMMMSFSALGVVGIVYVLWGWSMSYAGGDVAGLFANGRVATESRETLTVPFAAVDQRGLSPMIAFAWSTHLACMGVRTQGRRTMKSISTRQSRASAVTPTQVLAG